MAVRIILFIAVFLLSDFFLGNAFLSLLGRRRTIPASIMWGFIAITSVFQIIAYPMYRMNATFSLLFLTMTALFAAALALSIYLFIRDKSSAEYTKRDILALRGSASSDPIPFIVLACCVGVLLTLNYKFYTTTSDDSYYLARTLEVIAQNRLGISESVAWFGQDIAGFSRSTDASTFEFFKAYLSQISGIHATVLCHSAFNIVLYVVSFSAILTVSDIFLKDAENKAVKKIYILAAYIALMLISRTPDSAGMWMVRFIWSGKSLLPAIVFPALLCACAETVDRIDEMRWQDWIPVAAALMSGVSASIVGIFLAPVYFFCIGLSYMISVRFRDFGKVLGYAALSALPVIVTIAFSYFNIATRNTEYFTRINSLGISQWPRQLFGSTDKFMLLFFLAAAAYSLYKKRSDERMYIIYPSAILLLTFCNPLLITPISKYITTGSVYWRLFWIIPVYFFAACSLVRFLSDNFSRKTIRRFALLTALLIFGLSLRVMDLSPAGINLYLSECADTYLTTKGDYQSDPNIYGLKNETIGLADAILADWGDDAGRPVLLQTNADQINEIRQYTALINEACGIRRRQIARQTGYIEGTDVRQCDFINSYKRIDDGVYLHDMLVKFGVDYVDLGKDPLIDDLEKYGFRQVYEDDLFRVWRVE